MRKLLSTALCAGLLAWACGSNAAPPFPLSKLFPPRQTQGPALPPRTAFPDVPYANWSNDEAAYRLYPGDEIEANFPGLPTANKVVTVRPDGRITLPVTGEDMMVAGRSVADIRAEASQRLARYGMRVPIVEMQVKAQPIKVFIGGEVKAPGEYALTGDDNAFQAIIRAGGSMPSADMKHVQVIRRASPGPNALKDNVDLTRATKHGLQPDLVPLARGDVVYVPRTGLANIGIAVQSFLAALPVSFSYSVNGYR